MIHTRECHKPDLSDLPAAKRDRGKPDLRIGDPGPMGRILVAGEPGADIIPEVYPAPGELVIDKPGKGLFMPRPFRFILQTWGKNPDFRWCHHRSLRPNHDARSQ